MAILRTSELRDLGDKELDQHLTNLHQDLMKIKGVLASGGLPEDVGKARAIKRTIARILTIKKEKEIKTK